MIEHALRAPCVGNSAELEKIARAGALNFPDHQRPGDQAAVEYLPTGSFERTTKEPGNLEQRLDRYRLAGGKELGQEMGRSEEHTSELQSLRHLVCSLLLEQIKKMI